jgi:hypothetical protein
VHGQSVAAMVGAAWMVNGLPPDRYGAGIPVPVKESREMRDFLRLVGTHSPRRRVMGVIWWTASQASQMATSWDLRAATSAVRALHVQLT